MIPLALKNLLGQDPGKRMLHVDNVADAIVYCLSTPPNVQIQEMIIRALHEGFPKPHEIQS